MHNPTYSLTNITDGAFLEIEARVARIKEEQGNRYIWSLIDSNPITLKSINRLLDEGWTLEWNSIEYRCSTNLKSISLLITLQGYQRDKTLFHEIVHACYGEELSDRMFSNFEHDNRTIAEWLARKLRANPSMLRHAVLSFGLEPRVYDLASYESFIGNRIMLDRQLRFPFYKDTLKQLLKVDMD